MGIMFMYVFVGVCVCVSIGPTRMGESIQTSLFQTVIKNRITETTIPAMFGKKGLPLFIEAEAKVSVLLVKY